MLLLLCCQRLGCVLVKFASLPSTAHYPFVWSAICFVCLKIQSTTSTLAVRLVLGCGSLLRVMLFTCTKHGSVKKISETKNSNVVHFHVCRGSFALVSAVHSRLKKCLKKENKNSFEKIYVQQKEIMKFTWLSDAVRFSVRSSVFFHKKWRQKLTKAHLRKFTPDKKNHEVRLTLWCSALFRLKAVRFSSSSSKIYVPQKRNHAVL